MNNGNVPALLESVKVALRSGRKDEAEEICRKVFALDPGNPVALFTAAAIAANQGRQTAAIQYLRELLIRDPLSWKPHEVLCRLLLQTGEVEEAIAMGRRACELEPDAHEAHYGLGACYIEARRYEEAQASLDRAISLQPSFSPAHFHLGAVLRQLGRDEEAEAEFGKAIGCDRNAPEAYAQLAKLLLDHERGQEAISCLDAAFAATATPASQIALVSSLVQAGLHDHAEQPLQAALEADPNSREGLGLMGRLLQQLGRFQEAIACFERLLALYPEDAQTYLDLVQSRKVLPSDRPMLQTMAARLAKATLPQPDARQLHYALGKAYDDLAEYTEAFEQYQAANRSLIRQSTTDADWLPGFEHIARTFTPEFFAAHADIGSVNQSPTLIVGMIRSGTTLVEQILSCHPLVAAGGEQKFLYEHAELQLRPGAEILAQAPSVRDGYLQLLRRIGGSKRLVTDKMPLNFETLGLFHLMFPKGRIIHCVRNPADTCVSIYTTPVAKPAAIGHDPETIASFYRRYLRLMAHWSRVLPANRLHVVEYETMVADTEAETRKLLEFCDLEWNDACLHHETRGGAVVTPSTWQVRQPIYHSSVGRWQNYRAFLPQFGELTLDPLYTQET